MAKVEYLSLISGVEAGFYAGLKPADRYIYSRVARKRVFYTKKSVAGVTARSLLPQISALWAGFSDETKTAWSNAGAEMDLTGWKLFVKDQSIRIKNDFVGVATPSQLHQSYVGNIRIENPADEIKMVQSHPHFYYVSRKITGTQSQYQPVLVTEDLALPLVISLNYSSDLTAVTGSPSAKFYARVWHSYQGADLYTDLEIDLDLSAGWKNAGATLTSVIGYVVRYDLYFHLKGVTGNLYVDNISSYHSAQNWVRDQYCEDINQGFTRAFYQVPKHWASVTLPAGASYDSLYKDF